MWLAGLVVIGVACGEAQESEGWAGTVQEVSDVQIVQNPGEPLEPMTHGAPVRWSVPTPEQESRRGVWEEAVAVRARDSIVYVLDRMAHRVHAVLTEDGRWNTTFGAEGGGPGELRSPFGLTITEDAVVVGDGGRAALEFFGFDGAYRTSLQLGRVGFAVHALSRDMFIVHALLGSEGGWYLVPTDGEMEEFSWPEWVSQDPAGIDCAQTYADPAGVYRANCRMLHFQVVGHTGSLRREISVDRAPEAAEPHKLKEHLQNARAQMRASGLPTELIESQIAREEERLQPVPSVRAVRRNAVTGDYALWEQQPEELGSGSAVLHIFDAAGRYRASHVFDDPWVDFDWRGQRLYALERDRETGLEAIS